MLTNQDIANIIVTQESLRSIDNLITFIKMKKDGLKFDKVKISRLREYPNFLFAHDGHTRMSGCYLASAGLDNDEYIIDDYSISDYIECNFENGFVTPFNPLVEVRLRDFFFVKEFFIKNKFTEKQILQNKHLYCKSRTIGIETIQRLAERYTQCLKSE